MIVGNGDTSHGPIIKIDGKKVQTYLVQLIDDASRLIVGYQFFLNDKRRQKISIPTTKNNKNWMKSKPLRNPIYIKDIYINKIEKDKIKYNKNI